MKAKKTQTLKTSELHFDRQNPRLAEFGISLGMSDNDLISILWDAMDVKELVLSISASGFFQHEPLFVTQEDSKNIVIEGNRRLAAVKALTDPGLAKEKGWDVPELTKQQIKDLEELPVVISSREEAWRFLGFKHVNGPAKWGSYAKAKYIADVHRTYKIPLVDIAEQIGDLHKTVQRLYRGLMVIEQAEREGVYDREDRFRKRFAFSHLYTGLDYDGIRNFLSIKPGDAESDSPIPKDSVKNLGELCVWIYGSKKEKILPVIQSQNPHLRQLDSVVASREAIAALRSGEELAVAFEASLPSTKVFEDSLLDAKRALQKARAFLTTGYDNSGELLRIAGSVANLADDIYSEMERKKDPGKKNRISED